jgi:hypothetical protein
MTNTFRQNSKKIKNDIKMDVDTELNNQCIKYV